MTPGLFSIDKQRSNKHKKNESYSSLLRNLKRAISKSLSIVTEVFKVILKHIIVFGLEWRTKVHFLNKKLVQVLKIDILDG